jgi:molybdate transport system ATP-binding protein
VIEVHIAKDLGNFSLNLSMSLQKGLTVLFGPSGSGKTLTLHTIAGLVEPDSGTIRLNGVVYFDKKAGVNLPIPRRRIGYVFQEPSLFPHMSVFDNIVYGISGLSSEERNRRVKHMIDKMRLSGLEKNFPHQISGGQKQRVALARALVASPLILLLDEPFASLDHPVREKLRLDLLRIREEDRVPVVFVTHDVEEAFVLSDEIVVLNEGQVEQIGSKEDIFYRPQTQKVGKFFGVKNIFRGKITEIHPEEGEMTVWVDEKAFQSSIPYREDAVVGKWVRFCIRPEEIMVLKEDRPVKKNLKANIFTGRIVRIVEKGAEHTLFFKQGRDDYDFEISLPNLAYRSLRIQEGQLVKVAFKWESIWLIPEEKYVLGVNEAIRTQICSTKPCGTDIQIPIEHKRGIDHG